MKKLSLFFIFAVAMLTIVIASCNRTPDDGLPTTTVDNTAPTLVVTSPTASVTTNNTGTVNVAGTASDNVGFGGNGVVLNINGSGSVFIGKTAFNTNITLSDGSNAFTLQAFDARQNASAVQTFVVFVDVSVADTTAPVWSVNPAVADVMTTTFDITGTIDEAGTVYYVVLANDATAPTAAVVKAGTGALASGSMSATAGSAFTFDDVTWAGIADNTDYDVFVVAEDDEATPNLMASPFKIDVKTADAGDVTPPTITSPGSANLAYNSFDITGTVSESATVYYVVVADGTAAPTVDAVIAGTGFLKSGSKSATAAFSFAGVTWAGIAADTAYDVYLAARDGAANKIAAVVKVDVTTATMPTDTTAPTFTSVPASSSITETGFSIGATVDEGGDAYYIVVADGDAVPLASEVRAGVDYTGATVLDEGTTSTTAATPFSFAITGLTAGTAYDVYVVAEDSVPNLSTVQKVDVTTSAAPGLDSLTDVWAEFAGMVEDDTKTIDYTVDVYVVMKSGTADVFVQEAVDGGPGMHVYSAALFSAVSVGDEIELNITEIKVYGSSDNEVSASTLNSTISTGNETGYVAYDVLDNGNLDDSHEGELVTLVGGVSETNDTGYNGLVTITNNGNSAVYRCARAFCSANFYYGAPVVIEGAVIDQKYDGISVVNTETLGTDVLVLDIVAPIFESGPASAGITTSTFDITATIDEDGTVYYVVVANGASAPTSAEVVAGTGSGGAGELAAGNTSATASVAVLFDDISGGFSDDTDYDVYVVAADDEGTPNVQASPTLVDVHTLSAGDSTPPTFSVAVAVGNEDSDGFDITGTLDENGTVYYVVVADGAGDPTPQQVHDGQESGGGVAIASGNQAVTAGNGFTITVSGLSESTAYDVYVIAEDGIPNLQASVTFGEATTTAAASTATDLFFSEYGEPDGGNSKYVEIFNGTGGSVDLSGYILCKIANDGDWPENELQLSGNLIDGEVFVVANESSDAPVLAETDTTWSQANWNGDDPIGLFKDENSDGSWDSGDTLLDTIGEPYVGSSPDDPGAGWAVAGVAEATANHVLIRKSTITSGQSDWSIAQGTDTSDSEWTVMTDKDWTDLGSHTFAP